MLNALLAANLLMLAPIVEHLIADLWSLRTRWFSLIPHRRKHVMYVGISALGLLACAAFPIDGIPREFLLALFLMLAVTLRAWSTWRRLIVDPDTGLVAWRMLALPSFLQGDRSTTYIDSVQDLRKDRDGNVSLFGMDFLQKRYWSTGDDNVSRPTGFFSERELSRLVASFNAYREAFLQYDSEQARAQRAEFRRLREAKLEPVRAAREKRRHRVEERARRKKAEAAAREQARNERRRARYQQKLK
jgi:hypothetical protein